MITNEDVISYFRFNFPTRVKDSGSLVVNLSKYNCIYDYGKSTQITIGRCYLTITRINEVSNPESSRHRYSVRLDGFNNIESHFGYGNKLTLDKFDKDIRIRVEGDMPFECILKDRLCSGLLMHFVR